MPSTYDDPVYLAQLRRDLLRFARLQLRDADASEDAVQEALAAAWSHAGDFAGRSAHKTWVFGILRNKLVDILRARQRTVSLTALDAELDGESVLDRELFQDNGHWAAHTKPRHGLAPRHCCSNGSSGRCSRRVSTICRKTSAAYS